MAIGLALKDPSAARVRRLAPAAEQSGYGVLLFPELSIVGQQRYTGRDPFVSSAIALEATERLRAGPGVVGTVFHTPRHLAMRGASLMEASGGRFVLGVGASHRGFAEEIGVAYPASPLGHVRDHLMALRAVGERLAFPGPAPIWLAALGPRMAALGGELADGLLLNWVSPEGVRETIAQVRAATGRRPTIAVYLRLDTPDRLQAQARTYFEMFPNYARHFSRQGLHSPQAVAAATAAPIDDPGAIAERAAAYTTAGCDEVILYPADVAEGDALRWLEATPAPEL